MGFLFLIYIFKNDPVHTQWLTRDPILCSMRGSESEDDFFNIYSLNLLDSKCF